MSRFNSSYGFLLFQHPNGGFDETYDIAETAGKLRKIGLAIPQDAPSFAAFQSQMETEEDELRKSFGL